MKSYFFSLQDAELLQIVTEAFNDAYDILYSEDGWKEEKKNDEGDVVVSKKSKKGKSYKLVIVFGNYLLPCWQFERVLLSNPAVSELSIKL